MRSWEEKRDCRLSDIMIEKSIDKERLSYLTGISPYTIRSYMESEQRMTLKTAKRISVALDIRIDELYNWDQTSN